MRIVIKGNPNSPDGFKIFSDDGQDISDLFKISALVLNCSAGGETNVMLRMAEGSVEFDADIAREHCTVVPADELKFKDQPRRPLWRTVLHWIAVIIRGPGTLGERRG